MREEVGSSLTPRFWHASWVSPSGVILLGGSDFLGEAESPRTTERIGEGGSTTYGFALHYDST